MHTLTIEVPPARERTALARLTLDGKKVAEGFAAASASAKVAAARGNPGCDPLRAWGHPPLGAYRMINHNTANKAAAGEYGARIVLFEPLSGDALTAQSAGRVGVLLYGGLAGQDKNIRRTQGGVRVQGDMIAAIAGALQIGGGMNLVITNMRKPPWWKFWASVPKTPPLSTTELKAYSAPLDEMSIILELMNGATRHGAGGGNSDYRERERDRDDNRYDDDSSSSRSRPEPYQGGGGQSGGGGASGGWDSATSTARGVDASGRIMAGAAVGVVAATVAASAVAAASREDKSSGDAGAIASGGFGDTGSDSGSDTGSSTSTSTQY